MNMVAAVTFLVDTAPVLWTVAVTIASSHSIAAAPIIGIGPGGAASGGSCVLMLAPETLLVRDHSNFHQGLSAGARQK